MQFSEMVDFYELPARDRDQLRPELIGPLRRRSSLDQLRGEIRRRRRGRRLAYIDNMFPWIRSGFRYNEALAIHELLPDTLFFSMWDLQDPFPAPVHSIAEFPRLAAACGVTDTYGVFQMFLEGIAGTLPRTPEEPEHAFAGPDLSRVLHKLRIRLHGSIYPGGGFVPSEDGYARLRALAARMNTTLSYVPEVLEQVPAAAAVDQAFTATDFYVPTSERWRSPTPLVCMFAADAPRRKGLDVALAAFADLDSNAFHLHVVGPHLGRRGDLPEQIATFHGWLSPGELRELHRHTHVFLSPVRSEPTGAPGSYYGVTDGFPTQAAADAVSSGCLLMSANPSGDHRVLTPGVHYLEREPKPQLWRTALQQVTATFERARCIANAGSERVRTRMDIRTGTARKLELMGLLPTSHGRTDQVSTGSAPSGGT